MGDFGHRACIQSHLGNSGLASQVFLLGGVSIIDLLDLLSKSWENETP